MDKKSIKTATKNNNVALFKNLIKSFCFLLAVLSFQTSNAQVMPNQKLSVYESQVKKFKPEDGISASNSNDVRKFVYEWFTHFEHASKVDYYLEHLNNTDMSLSFPGQVAFTSHSDYTKWYSNLLAQTLWNFHDISKLQIKKTASHEFLVSFIVDWYGEVKSSSDQLAGWQSRKDSNLYHYTLRQTWTVKEINNKLLIQKLVVTAGNIPSVITE